LRPEVVNSRSDISAANEMNTMPAKQNSSNSMSIHAVPFLRMTRLPKIVGYNLEILRRFYPQVERDLGRESTVEAMVLVDEHGDIVDIQILKSGGKNFDAAAIKVLHSKAVTIQPGYVGSSPVVTRVSIPIAFRLSD